MARRAPTKEQIAEFQRYQEQLVQFSEKHQEVVMKMRMLARDKARTELTLKELAEMPEGTNTYQAVGRSFLAAPLGEVRTDLNQAMEKFAKDLRDLEAQKSFLERKMTGLDKTVREFFSQR
eukprot:gnl/Trimastix_PCT/3268.p1 GENE.gnl/Trimastix_PCT/3268~~gnl/Trimastix_PCT/3268.p1  ORF type:complete len:121 (-),score=33.64 gnl/Trimastix_PCT/3268:35-397(-)